MSQRTQSSDTEAAGEYRLFGRFVRKEALKDHDIAVKVAGFQLCELCVRRSVTRWFDPVRLVESRSGAVAARPLRFHSPLIKLDVRISRIQLSDQGRFMLSPTGGWRSFW